MFPEVLPPTEELSTSIELLLGLRDDVQLLTVVCTAIAGILLAAFLSHALLGWVHGK